LGFFLSLGASAFDQFYQSSPNKPENFEFSYNKSLRQ
jgi:hypothetical protein